MSQPAICLGGLSGFFFTLCAGLALYAFNGSFHPHGYEGVLWILAAVAAGVLGTVAAVMAFLFYSLQGS